MSSLQRRSGNLILPRPRSFHVSTRLRPRVMAGKHIPIDAWLGTLGMNEYLDTFKEFSGVEDILFISESEIRDLGVRNSAHRARLVSSLVVLREKLQKRVRSPSQGSPCHSNSSSPPSWADHPDYAILQQPTYQDCGPQLASSPLHQAGFPPQIVVTKSELVKELHSHRWYHGNIPRQKAEKLLERDGDFLVRDSISQPGDFVLTCRWNNGPLHFKVNKRINADAKGAHTVQYLFEEELFDGLGLLIKYHMQNQKPISEASGAIICTPVNRKVPIDYYDNKHMAGKIPNRFGGYSPMPSPLASPRTSPRTSPCPSPPSQRRTHKRAGSQPLLDIIVTEPEFPPQTASVERRGSVPSLSPTKESFPALPVEQSGQSTNSQIYRRGSDSKLSPPEENKTQLIKSASAGSEGDLTKPPPPKPSRIPSVKYKNTRKPRVQIRNKALYEDDGKDYADYDQIKTMPKIEGHSPMQTFKFSKFETGDKSLSKSPQNKSPSRSPRHGSPIRSIQNGMSSSFSANILSVSPNESQSYDVPKSISLENVRGSDGSHLKREGMSESFRNRMKSDTNFDVLDCSMSSGEGSPIKKCFNDHLVSQDEMSDPSKVLIPKDDPISHFHLGKFTTELLSQENKPLEQSAVNKMKQMILEEEPKTVASHITKADLELLKIMGNHDLGVGVHSGLELLTLPHGQRLRQDVIERFYCMEQFVALMVLSCSGYPERAKILHQWVQISSELRTSQGNLFGFAAIMQGLKILQVKRLRNTWIALRQRHPESSSLYESRLSNMLQSLDDATSILPLQNVCIPHIMPLVEILERDSESMSSLLSWEQNKSDFGIDALLAHLDTARIITQQCALYSSTADAIMKDFELNQDLLDTFSTEVHLRLLWGAKGAAVNRQDRYTKFNQLLTVLSERAESSQGKSETSL